MELSPGQLDALREFLNIGVGRAAGVLNSMLESHVTLRIPQVEVHSAKDLGSSLPEFTDSRMTSVHLGFYGVFSGQAALLFPTDSADRIIDVVAAGDDDEEEPSPEEQLEIRIGVLEEVGNIVVNGVMGAINNLLSEHIEYRLPTFTEGSLAEILNHEKLDFEATALVAHTTFSIQDHDVEGGLVLVFEKQSFDDLLRAIANTQCA